MVSDTIRLNLRGAVQVLRWFWSMPGAHLAPAGGSFGQLRVLGPRRRGGRAGGVLVDGRPSSTDHPMPGLESLIAADVISSVVSPMWSKVGVLAAIVGIRTVLSFFLRMEVRQAKE